MTHEKWGRRPNSDEDILMGTLQVIIIILSALLYLEVPRKLCKSR